MKSNYSKVVLFTLFFLIFSQVELYAKSSDGVVVSGLKDGSCERGSGLSIGSADVLKVGLPLKGIEPLLKVVADNAFKDVPPPAAEVKVIRKRE